MPSAPDWRSASAYAYVHELNRREFAWEYLRRNPSYKRDYRGAIPRVGKSGGVRSSRGGAFSLLLHPCRRTVPRSFGCPILIPPPFSSFRQLTPFQVPALL